jgi:AGZA family xanthine/uracil permease-like MFS transporter
VIDRNFKKAAGFALAGAILTFFGFMHGERIGFAQSPVVAFSYAAVAALMMSCAKFAVVTSKPSETVEHLEAVSASIASPPVPNV